MMRRNTRRGSASVEFALILPFLLALVTGLTDFGWFMLQADDVTRAVREGVRHGVALEDSDDPAARAEDYALDVLEDMGFDCDSDCTVEATIVEGTTTDMMTMDIVIQIDPVIGLVPLPSAYGATLSMAMPLD